MTAPQALERCLMLQNRPPPPRRARPDRRASSNRPRRSRHVTHTEVTIGGHKVAVTEDDVGIVELHEV